MEEATLVSSLLGGAVDNLAYSQSNRSEPRGRLTYFYNVQNHVRLRLIAMLLFTIYSVHAIA